MCDVIMFKDMLNLQMRSYGHGGVDAETESTYCRVETPYNLMMHGGCAVYSSSSILLTFYLVFKEELPF